MFQRFSKLSFTISNVLKIKRQGPISSTFGLMSSAVPFRANIHQGGSASVIRPTAEERQLAIKAAKAMGLAVAGVDLIRSKSGPLLLEVNSSPGLEGIESVTGKDIASLIIEHIETNARPPKVYRPKRL